MTHHSAPAPWHLTGHGYVLLYKFPADFAAQHSPYGPYQGGFGAVMLVNYTASNVGPYYELLLIPGQVELPGKTGYSISHILVSTEASVHNGRANWGIPKYRANFDWHSKGPGETIQVSQDHQPVFQATLRGVGPHFPVTGAILPPIVQAWAGKTFITRLQASGKGQLARITDLSVEGYFPPFSAFRPLLAIKIADFKLTFPIPEVI